MLLLLTKLLVVICPCELYVWRSTKFNCLQLSAYVRSTMFNFVLYVRSTGWVQCATKSRSGAPACPVSASNQIVSTGSQSRCERHIRMCREEIFQGVGRNRHKPADPKIQQKRVKFCGRCFYKKENNIFPYYY